MVNYYHLSVINKLLTSKDCSDQQEVELSTGCYQSLDLAKSWLKRCVELHRYCQTRSPEKFDYPTRLLNIGSGVLKLALASEISNRAPYATLSHCWGKSMPLKLLNDNFANFRIGISHSELCKTFNDAIIVARHLGINYIWIDSLCIIQDNPEDWLQESAKMSSVYSCSTINIAATGAKDGTIGCFFKGLWNFQLPIPMRKETRFWEFSLSHPYRKLNNEPLLDRAWVFQERFLAPRTLHFTSSQIFWECEGGYGCGMSPMEESPWGRWDADQFPRSSHKSWHLIVSSYSKGMLTYATDRLVAISGVARWLQAQNKDDYLAGMWRKDLESQLCWRADYHSLSRPKVYLAPSWSWASILGHVFFTQHEDKKTKLVRVLSAHTILEDKDYKFGKVTSGVLRLSVESLICVIERTTGLPGESGDIYTPSGDVILRHSSVIWDCREDPRNNLYFLPLTEESHGDDELSDIYGEDSGGCEEPMVYRLDGLVLEATDTPKRAEYRRVGYLEFTLANEFRGKDDKSLYEEVEESGTKLRVINII
jgi:hypothetical protein